MCYVWGELVYPEWFEAFKRIWGELEVSWDDIKRTMKIWECNIEDIIH